MRTPYINTNKLLLAFALLSLVALRASAQAGGAQSRIVAAVDDTKLTILRGNTHPLARPQFDRGPAPGSLPMNHLLLVLKRSPAQEAALDKLLAEQQDRSSPNFHKGLTPAQFGQQFGPSDRDIQTITSWLQSHGFEVVRVSNGRTVIDFSGTAGQVQSAFHTTIHKYVLANGEEHWANSSDPQIPTELASVVAGVNKLNDIRPRPMHHVSGAVRRSMVTGKMTTIKPQTTLPGLDCYTSDSNCYGVGPYDFAKIYNVSPLWNAGTTGTGQTIAIVSDSDVYDADYTQFRSLFGLPALTLNRILPTGSNPGVQFCGANTDEEEAILDVEWAGAVAPGATIDLVISPSEPTESCNGTANESGFPFGGDYSAQYVVDHNVAPILSYSYGLCELSLGTTQNQFYSNLWQQAAAEMITVSVATGDNGSAGCDSYNTVSGEPTVQPAELGLAVNGVASTPYNVAVGGTDFDYPNFNNPSAYWTSSNTTSGTTQTLSAVGYIPEMAYNDTCTNFAIYQGLVGVYGLPDFGNAESACNNATLQASFYLVGPAGGGGGPSNCTTSNGPSPQNCSGGYAQPCWQGGPTTATCTQHSGITTPDSTRDLPDLALFAGDGTISGTATLVCEEDLNDPPAPCSLTVQGSGKTAVVNITAEGGTSVSAQAFAGIMALVNQAHGPQGNVNPFLYQLAAGGSASSIFNDVTVGTNAMPCLSGTTDCSTAAFSPPNLSPGPDAKIAGRSIRIACALCIGILLLLAFRRRQQRWATVAALLALVLLVANAGCGGSSSTTTPPGGSSETIGVLTGYNAGAGYDRATGLGSLNVANLVNASGWAAAPDINAPATIKRINTAPAMLPARVPVLAISNPANWRTASAVITLACALCLGILFLSLLRRPDRWSVVLLALAFGLLILNAGLSGGSAKTTNLTTGAVVAGNATIRR